MSTGGPAGARASAPGTVVVGGGVVGLSCALALRRSGHDTLLLDPPSGGRPASWGNAGHIAIEQVAPLASLGTLASLPGRLASAGGPVALPPGEIRHWGPFGVRLVRAAAPSRFRAGRAALGGLLADAMPAWRRLAASLGRPDLLIEHGHAAVWHDRRAAARGAAAWLGSDLGSARVREATHDERAAMARVLADPPVRALVFDGTGQVSDPGLVLRTLADAFREAGGTVKAAAVRRLGLEGGRAFLDLDGGERLVPDRILVAAGVASGALLASLGLTVPMIAERGYHVQAADHGWPADLPPMVFEERSVIATRFEGGLRVAGFTEFGRHEAPPNPDRWHRLERHTAELGLPVSGPLTRWQGSRPTLPDYLPCIGRCRETGAVHYAFGHNHLGLTLAPLTAELVAAAMTRETGGDLPPAFSIDRFRR